MNILLEIEKKEIKTLNAFQTLLRAFSTIRAGRATAAEEMFIRELPRTNKTYLDIPRNNPKEVNVW